MFCKTSDHDSIFVPLLIFNSLQEIHKKKNNLKGTRDIHTHNTRN